MSSCQRPCCSCDVCYCGPNCQCTEELCRCEASSVLNSLGMSSSITGESELGSATAEWKVSHLSCCSKNKIKSLFLDNRSDKSQKSDQNIVVDTASGTVRATVKGKAHADQLTKRLRLAGFDVRFERINTDKLESGLVATPTKAGESQGYIDPLASAQRNSPEDVELGKPRVTELAIGGMTCTMCSQTVRSALEAISGVVTVSVSLATTIARIEYHESSTCNPSIMKDAIEDVGFSVRFMDDEKPKASNSPITHRLIVVEFAVAGMTCSMCSNAIQNALSDIPTVKNVSVSLATNIARVEFEESPASNATLLKEAIEDIGYSVEDVTYVDQELLQQEEQFSDNDPQDRLQRLLRIQEDNVGSKKGAFLWSLAGALPILLLTMVIPHVFPSTSYIRKLLSGQVMIFNHGIVLEALILWILATPVQFGSGYTFYKSFYYGVFVQGVLGMDVLIALGTSASYAYAAVAAWSGEPEYHFFETSAVLICFVLLGKWMNALAVRRTSKALTQLMQLQAKTALKVLIPAGSEATWNPLSDPYEEEIVPIQTVQPGDLVKVLKGASIPADGVIVHGEMSVDESMISGESIPVLKTPGSIVLGGTICTEAGSGQLEATNVTAAAFVQVTGVGSSTALAQIVQLVQEAQSRQVPIQHFADTVSAVFVPTVVTISILTFMVWYALCNSGVVPTEWYGDETPATFSLTFAIACLVISCPCALGLATPTAVMVGTGVGARHGVLMKGGETLEMASHVDSVVFDKTGTLTAGKPVLSDSDFIRIVPDTFMKEEIQNYCPSGSDQAETLDHFLLWLFGSLERNSEHPLASAIVSHAEGKLKSSSTFKDTPFSQPTDFRALTGRGASGTIDGKFVVSVGNRAFAAVMEVSVSRKVEDYMQSIERRGKTAILAAVNGTVCAVLGIADELKPDASVSIEYLRDLGVDVWMVTGDNRRTANSIARQLNLPPNRVISEALPAAKAEQVRKLQSQGHVVAMVGDGVNDSVSLTEADVGMSLGKAAEIAMEASDIVLVKGNVSDVCTALHLTRVIFRRIQLNFLWALLYNCLGIPLAAGCFYPVLEARLPPTMAALAMALSSISVVCSSLALQLYKPPRITASSASSVDATEAGRRERHHHHRSHDLAFDTNDDLTQPLLESV